jgi:hypothetical protein
MLLAPAVAVTAPVPPAQSLATLGLGATCMLVGRLSVKLAWMVLELVLVILKVRVDAVLGFTVVGLKPISIDGGCKGRVIVMVVEGVVTPSNVAVTVTVPAELGVKVELASPLEKSTGEVTLPLPVPPVVWNVTGAVLNAARLLAVNDVNEVPLLVACNTSAVTVDV